MYILKLFFEFEFFNLTRSFSKRVFKSKKDFLLQDSKRHYKQRFNNYIIFHFTFNTILNYTVWKNAWESAARTSLANCSINRTIRKIRTVHNLTTCQCLAHRSLTKMTIAFLYSLILATISLAKCVLTANLLLFSVINTFWSIRYYLMKMNSIAWIVLELWRRMKSL